MNDVRKLINSRENSLKMRLKFLFTELKKSQTTHLDILVPGYKDHLQDEIRFVELQLSKIKSAKKSTLKLMK